MLCKASHFIVFPEVFKKWAFMRDSTQEKLSSGFANNKGADQPTHLHSLISTFVIHLLESSLCSLAQAFISKILYFHF